MGWSSTSTPRRLTVGPNEGPRVTPRTENSVELEPKIVRHQPARHAVEGQTEAVPAVAEPQEPRRHVKDAGLEPAVAGDEIEARAQRGRRLLDEFEAVWQIRVGEKNELPARSGLALRRLAVRSDDEAPPTYGTATTHRISAG